MFPPRVGILLFKLAAEQALRRIARLLPRFTSSTQSTKPACLGGRAMTMHRLRSRLARFYLNLHARRARHSHRLPGRSRLLGGSRRLEPLLRRVRGQPWSRGWGGKRENAKGSYCGSRSVAQRPADDRHRQHEQQHPRADEAQRPSVPQQIVPRFRIDAEKNRDHQHHAPCQ